MYNCIFLGRKCKKDEFSQWVHIVEKNKYSKFESQNVILKMWLKENIDGKPKESYPLINELDNTNSKHLKQRLT